MMRRFIWLPLVVLCACSRRDALDERTDLWLLYEPSLRYAPPAFTPTFLYDDGSGERRLVIGDFSAKTAVRQARRQVRSHGTLRLHCDIRDAAGNVRASASVDLPLAPGRLIAVVVRPGARFIPGVIDSPPSGQYIAVPIASSTGRAATDTLVVQWRVQRLGEDVVQ